MKSVLHCNTKKKLRENLFRTKKIEDVNATLPASVQECLDDMMYNGMHLDGIEKLDDLITNSTFMTDICEAAFDVHNNAVSGSDDDSNTHSSKPNESEPQKKRESYNGSRCC